MTGPKMVGGGAIDGAVLEAFDQSSTEPFVGSGAAGVPLTSGTFQSSTELVPLANGNGTSSVELWRSEEHTSELQSLTNLVCRLLLEKKKKQRRNISPT